MKKQTAIIARTVNGYPIIWNAVNQTVSIPRLNIVCVGYPTIESAIECLHRNFTGYRETPNVIEYVNGW